MPNGDEEKCMCCTEIRFVAWKYEMQTTIVVDRSPEFWKIGIKRVKPQNITKMNDLGFIEIALSNTIKSVDIAGASAIAGVFIILRWKSEQVFWHA